MEDDDKSWLPTEAEINDIGKPLTTEEELALLRKQLDLLLAESERKKIRNGNYEAKQAKNPHRFVRFYRVKNKELSKSNMLNNTDKAFLFDAIPYANRETNIITSDRGIPMTAKEICKELGYSKATFYAIIKKLIECGVVIQEPYENKVYFKLNPEYFDY